MTAPRRSPNWTVPTRPPGTSDNSAASTAFVTQGGAGPRTRLTAAALFFFGPAGNDSNSGLTSATPWATLNPLFAKYDFGGQNVTMQMTPATSTYAQPISLQPWTGGGSLIIDGGAGNVSVSGANNCINSTFGAIPGPVIVQNFAAVGSVGGLASVSGYGILINSPGIIYVGPGMNFGACGAAHMACLVGGGIIANTATSYTISGNSQSHFNAQTGGEIQVGNVTALFTTNVAFANFAGFAIALTAGVINTPNWAFNLQGHTVTGRTYLVTLNSVINTSSSNNANYFPGNVAGVAQTGGIYQ